MATMFCLRIRFLGGTISLLILTTISKDNCGCAGWFLFWRVVSYSTIDCTCNKGRKKKRDTGKYAKISRMLMKWRESGLSDATMLNKNICSNKIKGR